MIARTVLALPLVVAIASCTNPLTIDGPSTSLLAPSGIEHVLALQEHHPWNDVTSTPRIQLIATAEPECTVEPDVITLAPGETSGNLWFGGIIQDRGRYRISVRHAIEPEIWGTIDVTVR